MGKFVHERSGDDVKTRTRPLPTAFSHKSGAPVLAFISTASGGASISHSALNVTDGPTSEPKAGSRKGGQAGVVEVGAADEGDVGRVLAGSGDALDADQPAGQQTAVAPTRTNEIFVV